MTTRLTQRARERDLAHDADPVRFGNATLRCDGYTPDCSFYGRCMMGGECFASPPHLVAARMVEALIPDDGRAGVHLALLRKVATMLRDDRVLL